MTVKARLVAALLDWLLDADVEMCEECSAVVSAAYNYTDGCIDCYDPD